MTPTLDLYNGQTPTTVTMYDSVSPSSYPPDTDYFAAYDDGDFSDFIVTQQRFPQAIGQSITVKYGTKARIIDQENGDATQGQAALQIKGGLSDTIYCSESPWASQRAVCANVGISPFYWIASYIGEGETWPTEIPAAWVGLGCVAWQFTDTGPFDVSLALLSWTGGPLPVTAQLVATPTGFGYVSEEGDPFGYPTDHVISLTPGWGTNPTHWGAFDVTAASQKEN